MRLAIMLCVFIRSENSRFRPSSTITAIAVFCVTAFTALALFACGSDGGAGGGGEAVFQQVSDHSTVFTTENLDATGYKVSREYELDGLEGATAALYGFWRIPAGDPVDFEIRLYASHADAAALGTALAQEGSGTDAVLDADDATYDEGIRDRRMIIGKGTGGGGRSGTGPRYGDYAIYGNVVMLCQGAAVEQALDRCRLFAEALDGTTQP